MIMEGSVMQKAIWHITTGILMFLLLWLLASCSRDTEVADVLPSADGMTLDFSFKLPMRATEEDNAKSYYEDGEAFENYVDVANGKYRIYFFDTDNKLIARFEPHGFITTEGSGYRQYNALGEVPAELAQNHSAFKMVVLANWPQFDDASLKAGETTIEDICNADWAQFDCLKNHVLSPDAGRLIPFFGVHEYTDVTFKAGQATLLSEPVTLLRAMAKVEVTLETDDYYNVSFNDIRINRYNAKGYCAPKDVSTQSEYDHKGSWADDYVHTLHLVGDKNDDLAADLAFHLVGRWSEGTKRYEKWMVYLPEYRNVGAGDAYSSIKAKFNIQLAGDLPHTIYFANYSDGVADNSDSPLTRLNIERNNIYRFRVKCTGYNFRLLLSVSNWEGLYENTFDFGNGQIVSPISPWEDETTNDIEF